jgi:hypothetical protein
MTRRLPKIHVNSWPDVLLGWLPAVAALWVGREMFSRARYETSPGMPRGEEPNANRPPPDAGKNTHTAMTSKTLNALRKVYLP